MPLEGANFDPEHFPNPGSIELDRPNPTAPAFGRDSTSVLISSRSPPRTQIGIEALLKKMPGVDLAVPIDQLVWRTRFQRRIPERLPVLWVGSGNPHLSHHRKIWQALGQNNFNRPAARSSYRIKVRASPTPKSSVPHAIQMNPP